MGMKIRMKFKNYIVRMPIDDHENFKKRISVTDEESAFRDYENKSSRLILYLLPKLPDCRIGAPICQG